MRKHYAKWSADFWHVYGTRKNRERRLKRIGRIKLVDLVRFEEKEPTENMEVADSKRSQKS